MSIFIDNEYIIRKQAWEDYQEELAETESEILVNQLNKTHNRKGYLLADYLNGYVEDYY